MRGRFFVSLLALTCGIALAAVLVPRAVHTYAGLHAPLPTVTLPYGGKPPRSARGAHDAPAGRPHALRPVIRTTRVQRRPANRGGSLGTLALVGLSLTACFALLVLAAMSFSIRRVRRRHTRSYALYELHLSTHDQAKRQDLEDMVEQIAHIVRAWPTERLRNGQPYVALELICSGIDNSSGRREMEWSLNLRCEPRVAVALDGAIAAAYPDVRLGRLHGEQPKPRSGKLRDPRHLLRFCKQRPFVYPLIADSELQASSPLEQIARAQIAQDAPSVVRFQLTPAPSWFEALARLLYGEHERRLSHGPRAGGREGPLFSTLHREEMRAAARTQNRSLFWLEPVVAADDREVCRAVAAAVISRRGENRLRRRWMVVRHGLYRRRFPRALAPLIPSFRCLVSAAEVAHLLELPSARMKGVPVRRVTIPRLPAPPEIVRGSRPLPAGPPAREGPQVVAVASTAGGDGAADPARAT